MGIKNFNLILQALINIVRDILTNLNHLNSNTNLFRSKKKKSAIFKNPFLSGGPVVLGRKGGGIHLNAHYLKSSLNADFPQNSCRGMALSLLCLSFPTMHRK
jgi:hypothetical protein